MKVGCPGCGHHYEVDANSIEHFFHCTECGIFFRGINAQPVAEKKFKHSKDASELEDVGTALPSGTQEVKFSEAAQSVPEKSAEWAPDEATEQNRPKPLTMPGWMRPVMVGAGIAAMIVVIAVLIVQSMQLSAVRSQLDSAVTDVTLLKQRMEQQNQQLEEAVAARETLAAQLEKLRTLPEEANAKIGAADLNAALLTLNTRINDLSKAFGTTSPEVVAALDERVKTVEKRSAELEAQSKAAGNYFKELLKLVGPTKNRAITRTMLERLDYMEAVLSRDLSASGTPRGTPRIPVLSRLAALEALVAGGSEGMQTSPNYPSGIIGQLEALKTQVNQIKWALGK